ncbi:hypothetical protein SAMN05660484_00036 [Eubacterium ruminantium]|uniref:hypothetical protein n=1 Tax=Eubacterium ruminantium TaxID=42322 RepID=UPI000871A87E|nr:hypothetical protein [Eubacterium ruminantium]SCW26663.1 hypothetical protein SAMN05660484_00036 [Eubacterium ruminantium]SDM16980.1 hypothetical protein SAMN04490370_101261 [Eubacterium ruminantium]
MYEFYEPNPVSSNVGDCAVRAISKALDIDWEKAYALIVVNGFRMGNVPSSDAVWGSVLRQNGFTRATLPDDCDDCYTAEEFCIDHPKGVYVLGFGGHTATVVDGTLFDSWDSSHEVPQFYWYKEVD